MADPAKKIEKPSDPFSAWTRMWAPSWLFAPDTDTETNTFSAGGNIDIFAILTQGMSTADAAQEQRIIQGVASYGRQLGRISDVLNVLISLVDTTALNPDQQQKLDDFSEMLEQITKEKVENQLELLLKEIGDLKDQDKDKYQELVKKLRDFTAGA
jgi:hypothetical protein